MSLSACAPSTPPPSRTMARIKRFMAVPPVGRAPVNMSCVGWRRGSKPLDYKLDKVSPQTSAERRKQQSEKQHSGCQSGLWAFFSSTTPAPSRWRPSHARPRRQAGGRRSVEQQRFDDDRNHIGGLDDPADIDIVELLELHAVDGDYVGTGGGLVSGDGAEGPGGIAAGPPGPRPP